MSKHWSIKKDMFGIACKVSLPDKKEEKSKPVENKCSGYWKKKQENAQEKNYKNGAQKRPKYQ